MKNRAVFICMVYWLQNKILNYTAREIGKSLDLEIMDVDMVGFQTEYAEEDSASPILCCGQKISRM